MKYCADCQGRQVSVLEGGHQDVRPVKVFYSEPDRHGRAVPSVWETHLCSDCRGKHKSLGKIVKVLKEG